MVLVTRSIGLELIIKTIKKKNKTGTGQKHKASLNSALWVLFRNRQYVPAHAK